MKRIKLADKEFELSITSGQIEKAIWQMALQMETDLKDKNPLMICILNGSFMFAAELMKKLTVPCQISFLKLASYQGEKSSGNLKELIGLNESLKNRTIVILEDIVDTGITIESTIQQIAAHDPAEIKVATLLFKPDACLKQVKLDYVGLSIPNDFIVGFGLDYLGYGRNLPDIYTVIN